MSTKEKTKDPIVTQVKLNVRSICLIRNIISKRQLKSADGKPDSNSKVVEDAISDLAKKEGVKE